MTRSLAGRLPSSSSPLPLVALCVPPAWLAVLHETPTQVVGASALLPQPAAPCPRCC